MNIGIVGTGYVGLVQGVVFAEFGISVLCMDKDEKKIGILRNKEMPIYEPGLKEVFVKNIEADRLHFTSDICELVKFADVIFIAVGTPSNEDGSADLRYVESVAREIAQYIESYKVIVTKSTVPIGTGKRIKKIIKETLVERNKNVNFDIVSNPEFLREGKALHDCINPDRIIIGYESEKARKIMEHIYDLKINKTPFVFTNIETAEMIKYASNSFLAVKISFINEMALLAEKVDADIQVVASAMGMDGRISPKFLHAGPGYGGSCFPKDTKAIVDIGRQNNLEMKVVNAAIEANKKQKQKMIEKICDGMKESGGVKGKNICVLGLSFKPDTDDIREAPSLDIIRGLVEKGANIKAYCPQGMKAAKEKFEDIKSKINYMEDEYEAMKEADALVILTEWYQFRSLDIKRVKENMRGNYFFDLRNIYANKRDQLAEFNYYGVGIGV